MIYPAATLVVEAKARYANPRLARLSQRGISQNCRMLTILAAILPLVFATPLWPARAGDDDQKQTIEAEILKTLLDNGAITEKQYNDLMEKAAKIRRERVDTHEELERAIKLMNESIEERLRSQEGKKEEPTATVFFKNGIYFKSTDGNYQLHPWLVLRQRFTYADIGNVRGLANEDTASFENRTSRVWFDGHAVTPDLTFLLMFDLAGSSTLLRDSWIDYKFSNALHIRAGQQKRPIDYQGFTYAPQTGFLEKASTTLFFQRNAGEDFEPGAKLWGRLGNDTFEYHVGLFNGDGPQNGAIPTLNIGPGGGGLLPASSSNNDSSGLETVARLMWMPMGPLDTMYFTNGYTEGDYLRHKDPKFALGTHYSYNPERNNGAAVPVKTKADIQTWGADAVLMYNGLFALAEVFVRDTNRAASPTPDTTDNGYLAQLQYFFGSEVERRGFEILGRWAVTDVDAATLGLVPARGVTEVHDATFGVNYIVNGHRMKILTAYTYRNRNIRMAHDVDDQIFQAQVQVIF